MTKSVSKYTSVNFLRYLQRNKYVGKNGEDYCKEEVDSMLIDKLESHSCAFVKKYAENTLIESIINDFIDMQDMFNSIYDGDKHLASDCHRCWNEYISHLREVA